MFNDSCPDLKLSSSVRELHIDFLLEEEFESNPQFLSSFLEAAGADDALRLPADSPATTTRRSVSDVHGEADVVVEYLNSEGCRTALLIEDKLRATFQPEQAERYRQRGRSGVDKNGWNSFWTCLVAPAAYIARGHDFDAAVSLEGLVDLFSPDNQRRRIFKANVVRDAIRKFEATGTQVPDEVMTNFRNRYYSYFREFFTVEISKGEISTSLPRKAWEGDTWFEFRSNRLSKGAYINHKSERGYVDLTFPNTDVSVLQTLSCLEAGMTPHQTNKSSAVRLHVSVVTNFNHGGQESAQVEEAFAAVRRLLDFYTRNKDSFQLVLIEQERMSAVTG